MPLGSEVGLGPGDIVLDGHPAVHGKGRAAPTPQPTVLARSPISETADLLLWYVL